MSWSPHVTVAAVITDQQGRHLLVEETPDGTPVLNQPAGHLEAGENLLDAVRREVLEETCREFVPLGLVGVYQWVTPKGRTYLRFCFHGGVAHRLEGCDLDPDITTTHWVDPQQLGPDGPALRSPMVMRCIRDFLDGRHSPLDLLNELF